MTLAALRALPSVIASTSAPNGSSKVDAPIKRYVLLIVVPSSVKPLIAFSSVSPSIITWINPLGLRLTLSVVSKTLKGKSAVDAFWILSPAG